MNEQSMNRLSWVFVGLVGLSAAVAFSGLIPVNAREGEDHDEAHQLRERGDVVPLAQILAQPELAGYKVIEAELEGKKGRRVYELELLDDSGHVQKRYYDALTGQRMQPRSED